MINRQRKENKVKESIEKFSFIGALVLAFIAHIIVHYSNLDAPSKGIGFFVVWSFGICSSRFLYLYYNDLNFSGSWTNLNKSLKVQNILEKKHLNGGSYLRGVAIVLDVEDTIRFNRFCEAFIIKYTFGKKIFTGVKRFDMCKFSFTPNIPRIGDKVEVIYNKNNPEESIILYSKAKRTKWYKWQSKYEIRIIN